jgi:mono/diheme cytochrome c family protein
MRSRGMGIVIVAAIVAVVLLAMRMPVEAAPMTSTNGEGSVSAGRALAQAWCTECHSVEQRTARTGNIAPDFTEIANRRATTAIWLHAFLRSEHKTMPNFIVEQPEAADLVAYIMSLKRRR